MNNDAGTLVEISEIMRETCVTKIVRCILEILQTFFLSARARYSVYDQSYDGEIFRINLRR